MPTLMLITPAHAALYKQARLAALTDSPLAFGSTIARESALTDDDWLFRCTSLDQLTRTAFLALDDNNTPCGLIACFLDPDNPNRAEIISMWVAPSQRRTGLSRRLLEAAHQWAASRSVTELHLSVVATNHPAIAFYHRYGFTFTGRKSVYPNDPRLFELQMHLRIAPTS